jgi:hypothetical protein
MTLLEYYYHFSNLVNWILFFLTIPVGIYRWLMGAGIIKASLLESRDISGVLLGFVICLAGFVGPYVDYYYFFDYSVWVLYSFIVLVIAEETITYTVTRWNNRSKQS